LYFRADHDVVRDYKGSGLGIPIAFGLIEALDGTISLESQPDQGTRFTISIQGMS
jgi:signal transduction histidine kinase